jgi:hypothetical protein
MPLWNIKVIMQMKAFTGTRQPISSIPELSLNILLGRLIQKQGEKILSCDGVIIDGVWIS